MLEQFRGFIGYTDDEFKELWEHATFVVDTNILINFYKYTSEESTKKLLDILKIIKDEQRLWIPHHVALEYFFNYEENMSKQHEGYDLLRSEFKKIEEDAQKKLSTVKSKHPYITIEKFDFFINDVKESSVKLEKQIKEEIDKLPDSKVIYQEIFDLLDGIIGDPYSQIRITEIEKDGKERYQYEIPPGFKDKDDKKKEEFRTYGDFRYQQLYGDLIVWNQIMDRAKEKESPTPIIFITEDRKEDWWEKDGTKIKRPHPQLIQEFNNKTQQKFYMYRTDTFVRNAIKYLHVDVTDEQYEEVTTEIENIRKVEEQKENKHLSDNNIILNEALRFLYNEERVVYEKMIAESNDSELDSNSANYLYSKAFKWVLQMTLPRMEEHVKKLSNNTSGEDKEYSTYVQFILNNLPSDPIERVKLLTREILVLESKVFENLLSHIN
ncbi:PIN-like domain-containing protein [Lysinibacillus agricola]|uniref:PIN-like domain-containing protein n=1 Tax=Lysinibacillus agricola TaxID=2590012 RepID=UPI003C1763C5